MHPLLKTFESPTLDLGPAGPVSAVAHVLPTTNYWLTTTASYLLTTTTPTTPTSFRLLPTNYHPITYWIPSTIALGSGNHSRVGLIDIPRSRNTESLRQKYIVWKLVFHLIEVAPNNLWFPHFIFVFGRSSVYVRVPEYPTNSKCCSGTMTLCQQPQAIYSKYSFDRRGWNPLTYNPPSGYEKSCHL